MFSHPHLPSNWPWCFPRDNPQSTGFACATVLSLAIISWSVSPSYGNNHKTRVLEKLSFLRAQPLALGFCNLLFQQWLTQWNQICFPRFFLPEERYIYVDSEETPFPPTKDTNTYGYTRGCICPCPLLTAPALSSALPWAPHGPPVAAVFLGVTLFLSP